MRHDRDGGTAKWLLRRVVLAQETKRPQDLIPKRDADDMNGVSRRVASVSAGQGPVLWAWLDLNQRPHPQVKIPGRGGKLAATYQVDADLASSAEQWTAQRPCCAAHLHPSGVAAGHEPLTMDVRVVHVAMRHFTYPRNRAGERRCRGSMRGASRVCVWRGFWQISGKDPARPSVQLTLSGYGRVWVRCLSLS
jgi:hypothetical protein